jgi:type IV pilus assembly protein PilM
MRFQLPSISLSGARGQGLPSVLLAIDLGTSRLKCLRMQRRSGRYALTHCTSVPMPSPAAELPAQQEQIMAALRQCMKDTGVKRGHTVASISARSTLIRHVEFPQMPLDDMKKALKLNSAPYLHQQYTNFNFDCYIIPPRPVKEGEAAKGPSRLQVLVGGASTLDVLLFRNAIIGSGLVPLAINLAPVAVINAFESSNPQMMAEDTVALVDIGYENSVISIVNKGQPSLTRSIQFGGANITSHIAKTLSVDDKAAEDEKLKMSDAVQVLVASCLSSFARQVRSSVDFFERQHEVPVKRVFCSGGTALSNVILQFMTDEIGLPCRSWDATANIPKDLKNLSEETLKEQGPNYAVAVGTALGSV